MFGTMPFKVEVDDDVKRIAAEAVEVMRVCTRLWGSTLDAFKREPEPPVEQARKRFVAFMKGETPTFEPYDMQDTARMVTVHMTSDMYAEFQVYVQDDDWKRATR